MKTVAATPQRQRRYVDVDEIVPMPGETMTSAHTVVSSLQMENLADSEDFILLDDIAKECVHVTMLYYENLCKHTGEFDGDPDFILRVHEVITTISQDRPIRKELLLEMCPQLFTYEVVRREAELPLAEKYKHLGQVRDDSEKQPKTLTFTIRDPVEWRNKSLIVPKAGEGIDSDKQRVGGFQHWNPNDDIALSSWYSHPQYNVYELHERHHYIWNEVKLTYLKSEELLEALSDKLGSMGAALKYIELKGDNRTPEEQAVLDGMEYIKRLLVEQYEFTEELFQHYYTTVVLPFSMPQWLKDDFVSRMEHILTNRFASNFYDIIGIPDNTEKALRELQFKEQKAKDMMALDAKERKEAFKLIQDRGDELLVRRDLNSKDEQLIRKMNYLSEMIQVKKPPEPVPDFKTQFDPEILRKKLSKQMETGQLEGELYLENFMKMIYLNNAFPEKFDLDFWADNLNLKPQRLKNVFYHLSCPIIQGVEPVGKITFIEVPRKKEMFDVYEETQRRWAQQQRESKDDQ